MTNRWFKALFVVVFVLFSSGAVRGEDAAKAEDKGEGSKVLVEMKGSSISMEELQQRINRLVEQSGAKFDFSRGKEPILEEMILTKLFSMEARREKMDQRSDVAAEIKDAVEDILASNYLKEHVLEKIRITDNEIKAYMEKNPELFKAPESVGVRRILIKVGKDAPQETLEAAGKKAEEALSRIKTGEDFAKVGEAYSGDKKDKKKKRGGDISYIKKGEMGTEIDDIVFALKIGEVSPVLRTGEGFVIVKVEERKPSRDVTLKEARHYVTSRLMAEKENTAKEALAKELMEKYDVKVHKELLQ